ncbi:RNA-directed DNA polymerase, eukaryota, reverse transcriptase zinc-binding domain protein [Tanacetum coccineum]
MSRCRSCEPLIRFQNRLSKWKANTLSFGVRLTLIKSVLGSLGVYYFSTFKEPKKVIHKLEGIRRRFFWGGNSDVDKISWVAWDKVVSPRNKGGLGIGSLVASNNSLLIKWWWHFRNEGTSLWCNVIRSIHGPTGGILNSSSHKKASGRPSFSWTWRRSFWSEEELNEQNDLINLLVNLHVSNDCDVREFTYDASRRFSVNSMRKLISTMSSDNNSHHTGWNKLLSSKINILTWRVLNKRLPTRFNLDGRGIVLDTVRFRLCNNDIETEDHRFVKCPLAIDTWKVVFSWWQFIGIADSNLLHILTMADRLPMAHKHRKFFDVVVVTRGHLMIECQICRYEVQTDMSADMSVRGTRWQDTSVRGQEHPDVAQSQPSSSTIPVPSPSSPPVQSLPPIPTHIPASTPTPIPETDHEPLEHTFEEPSPAHQHFSPPQEHV